MHHHHRSILFASVVVVAAYIESAVAAPLEAYERLPLYENVSISPDGKRIAFVTTVGEDREAVIQSLSEGEQGRRIKVGKQRFGYVSWVGNEQLLFSTSQAAGFFTGSQVDVGTFHSFDLRRQQPFLPTSWPRTTLEPYLMDAPSLDAANRRQLHINFRFNPDGSKSAFYRIDFEKQRLSILDAAYDEKRSYSWYPDVSGRLIARSIYDEKEKTWELSFRSNGQWKNIHSEKAVVEAPYIAGMGPEPGVMIVHKIEDGQRVARRLSLGDGSWGEALLPDWMGVSYIYRPINGREIIGFRKLDVESGYTFFDKKLQQQWDQIKGSFPGEQVEAVNWTDDMNKVVVKVFGRRTGAAYVLADLSSQKFSNLGNLYSGIEARDIAQVRSIKYDASDGLQIGAYLTMPNRKEKKLPLVVLPHGGPAARDSLKFDWFAQALASRGYLVLQPNFRGSWGVNSKLAEAGYGEWGRKMQTDLSDGVRALIKLGVVDSERVCIVGSSYGGYAALMSATQESNIYRCAVSVAGISDLRRFFLEKADGFYREGGDDRSLRFDFRYFGIANERDPVLVDRSPLTHVDTVNIPVLLIHGDYDSVVPIKQSEVMADALKKAGKPYELIKLRSEDHWLSRSETRTKMLTAVIKFLETHNPP